ncbi:methyl-accepting chemotaxis protein [Paraburkholderia kururiensis]|uniref:Methyl-accepting chemotaxis protein n=1 Tax=Paraburkholderia kururiensis TaxID=984307 RepID=A0ABZ0WNY3_9BURK|nr:methyl-accepting chemotaxis protein [Paraburkholderia kururiensis]WQD79067.1 methyl-accepting chemotaxis protein [Paraburkholderia kururiensis]
MMYVRIPAALTLVVGAAFAMSLTVAAGGAACAYAYTTLADAAAANVPPGDALATYLAGVHRLEAVAFGGFAALALASGLLAFAGRRWLGAKVVRPLDHAMQTVHAIALGELRDAIVVDERTQARRLFVALQQMQQGLVGTLTTVTREAAAVDDCAGRLHAQNVRLSSGAESQAAAIQQTAATTQQISEGVQRSAQVAEETNRLAGEASELAQASRARVRTVIDAMDSIARDSQQISAVVSVVNELAFQTNILALNAAVEAARAGHQGKGFAVVAGEVRSLAQRSAAAAQEIEALIGSARGTIANGAQLCTDVGSAMDEVVSAAHEVAQLSDAMSRSASEQSHGVQQLNAAIKDIDAVTQQNAGMVQHLVNTTEDLNERARALAEAVGAWRLD